MHEAAEKTTPAELTSHLGKFARAVDFSRAIQSGFWLAFALLLIALTTLGLRGFNYGIDFTGGNLIEAKFAEPVNIGTLRAAFDKPVLIQQIRGENTYIFKQAEQHSAGQQAGFRGTITSLGGTIVRSEYVGPVFGRELAVSAALAVAMALSVVFVYLWVRFRIDFAIAAIICLLHDVALTGAVMSWLAIELNVGTVAALLTIAGYSINDTVVIFDRVRELKTRLANYPLITVLNTSVKQTLRRTVLTTVTTFMSVLALTFIGGTVIAQFSQVILFGLVIGTLSSVLVACSFFLLFAGRIKTKTPRNEAEIPDRFR